MSVGLNALLACDRSPHPHLLADELAQLFGAAQHQRTLLGFGELPGDALLAHAGRELGAVPTVAESGFPGFEAYAWWGVFAPAGTPRAIAGRFGAELTACVREERVARQLTDTQQVSLVLGGPEELRKFVGEQMRVWGAVAREQGIKAD